MAEFNRLDIPGAINRGRMNALALEQQEQNLALGDKRNALADLSIESGQMTNTQAKTTFGQNQAGERARVLTQMADALKSLPVEARPDAMARISQQYPEYKLPAQVDPQFLSDQGLDMLKAEASTALNKTMSNIPVSLQERNRLIEDARGAYGRDGKVKPRNELTPTQISALTELNVLPRLQGSGALTIAQTGSTQDVASSEATIDDATTRATENAKDIQEITRQSYDSLQAIKTNVAQLDEGIRLVKGGANSGLIQSKMPAIDAGTIKLRNLKTRLGLDVVAGGKFGPLSEGELGLALDVGLPDKLEGPELIGWMKERRDAQQKLANYLEETIQFLNAPNVDIADLQAYHKARSNQGKSSAQNAGSAETEVKQISTDEEYNSLPSGAEFIDPNGQRRRKP